MKCLSDGSVDWIVGFIWGSGGSGRGFGGVCDGWVGVMEYVTYAVVTEGVTDASLRPGCGRRACSSSRGRRHDFFHLAVCSVTKISSLSPL